MMRRAVAIMAVLGVWGCSPAADEPALEAEAPPAPEAAALPSWTFADAELFPASRGLSRSEDGIVLPDGTVIVTEQVNGMVAIAPDGSSMRPFGRFAELGYVHRAPDHLSAPNGVTVEPDGRHLLIADLYNGAIYRVDIATEETELLYQHPFGVNVALKDSTGAVWFTQSTENVSGPDTEPRIFETMDTYATDGVLFRIPPPGPDGALAAPEVVIDGLMFPNGLLIDEAAGTLYLTETTGHRVTSYDVDVASGAVSNRQVVVEMPTPDNVERDADGVLWIASPLGGRVVAFDPETGATQIVFRNQTEAGDAIVEELLRRVETQEPAMALVTPDAWAPMPGGLTGVIFAPDGRTVYLTGLGDALLKLER